MNLTYMDKKEYNKFRFFINIFVFVGFLLLFFFVEINQLLFNPSIITSIISLIVLSSLLLLFDVLIFSPFYSVYVGITFMVFSVIMIAMVLYLVSKTSLNVFSAAELITAIVLFLYGRELKSGKKKFISLKVLTNP